MQLEEIHPLPPEAVEVLRRLDASPRLLAHLVLVHAVAVQLVDALKRNWPRLAFDAEAVCYGAATHDVGKVLYPEELTGPGQAHGRAGQRLLEAQGVAPERARFARTHVTAVGDPDATPEDLLVALADDLWRGERDTALEQALTEWIATAVGDAPWAVFMDLDDVACALAQDGPRRLYWLSQFDVANR